jgi:hypothetical protein
MIKPPRLVHRSGRPSPPVVGDSGEWRLCRLQVHAESIGNEKSSSRLVPAGSPANVALQTRRNPRHEFRLSTLLQIQGPRQLRPERDCRRPLGILKQPRPREPLRPPSIPRHTTVRPFPYNGGPCRLARLTAHSKAQLRKGRKAGRLRLPPARKALARRGAFAAWRLPKFGHTWCERSRPLTAHTKITSV